MRVPRGTLAELPSRHMPKVTYVVEAAWSHGVDYAHGLEWSRRHRGSRARDGVLRRRTAPLSSLRHDRIPVFSIGGTGSLPRRKICVVCNTAPPTRPAL